VFDHLEAARWAISASVRSPCRSKRGVVIFDAKGLISDGWNYQPEPFVCDGSARCKSTCGRTAIHAEQVAILQAAMRGRGCLFPGACLLHVKAVKGRLVPSGPPSCLECSKLILAAGLAAVWLYHEGGWRAYNSAEFHRLSAESHGIQLLEKTC
jgi:deoxycytidylate deaminase